MRLSELADYAMKKYHIPEQRKWAAFPGYSVLVDPKTQKWVALLMRQRDPETGAAMELCDIKCGRKALERCNAPFVSEPYRMSGINWVGVRFDRDTARDVVFRLFDRAMRADELRGVTVVLDALSSALPGRYRETPLPFARTSPPPKKDPTPDRIHRMKSLYRWGDGSFREKCRNFYVQGKFMEDYEDDAPACPAPQRLLVTYHDLGVKQLRAYFSWRTQIRRGRFDPIGQPLARMYVFELLNGIGAPDVPERLRKLEAFEHGYIDAGYGDDILRQSLRKWALALAVITQQPREIALQWADGDVLARDSALVVLRDFEAQTDEAIFEALCALGSGRLSKSIVLKKHGDEGRRLFAAVWRHAAVHYDNAGRDLFTTCFGSQFQFGWNALGNALYWDEHPVRNAEYFLSPCHRFICTNGVWKEDRYYALYSDKATFEGLLHEADRQLRLYLKTGSPLKPRRNAEWAEPLVRAVIEADRAAKAEAARPQIDICFDALDRIRRDASLTRESLLTEEEKETAVETAAEAATAVAASPEVATAAPAAGPGPEVMRADPAGGLLPEQIEVLSALLRGESVKSLLRSRNQLAEVFADELNEALYDRIGDTAVACDGGDIALIEDYRGDIVQILGGKQA